MPAASAKPNQPSQSNVMPASIAARAAEPERTVAEPEARRHHLELTTAAREVTDVELELSVGLSFWTMVSISRNSSPGFNVYSFRTVTAMLLSTENGGTESDG